MQTNLPEKAPQRTWLRVARGGVTAASLLAVLAFALSFMDLSAFSATLASATDSPGLGLFDSPTPAHADKVRVDAGQDPVVVLNDWVYTSSRTGYQQTKQRQTKQRQTKQRQTKHTKRTQTKSPVHRTARKTDHKRTEYKTTAHKKTRY